jgi:hypothetical protein
MRQVAVQGSYRIKEAWRSRVRVVVDTWLSARSSELALVTLYAQELVSLSKRNAVVYLTMSSAARSTSHSMPSPSCRPSAGAAATFAPHLLRTNTSGALRDPNSAFAHFNSSSAGLADIDPWLRSRLHLPCAYANQPLFPEDTHATKSSLSATQLLSPRNPHLSISHRRWRLSLIIYYSSSTLALPYRSHGRRRRARLPSITRAGV